MLFIKVQRILTIKYLNTRGKALEKKVYEVFLIFLIFFLDFFNKVYVILLLITSVWFVFIIKNAVTFERKQIFHLFFDILKANRKKHYSSVPNNRPSPSIINFWKIFQTFIISTYKRQKS